jgi:hypothetical protein
MREKDHGKRLFYHKTELTVEFLDRGVTGSAQRFYGTLEGFGQANCLKTSDLLLQTSSFSWLSQAPWTTQPLLLVFLDRLRRACLANDVWLTWTHVKSHLPSVDIRNRFVEPRDTSLGAV